jgi:hypothetical protein
MEQLDLAELHVDKPNALLAVHDPQIKISVLLVADTGEVKVRLVRAPRQSVIAPGLFDESL